MQYTIRNLHESSLQIINLPASKSINNRLLIMSELSGRKLQISNLSPSDDVVIMKNILNSKDKIKNAGHAGTVMRFMTAFLSVKPGNYILTGTERMKNRPILELVESLKKLGADIKYIEKKGFPPLEINGKILNGGTVEINSGISSQYISALLMIGPYLKNGLKLILTGDTISSSYINLTIGLMKMAGASVSRESNTILVENIPYAESQLEVEADWSSASYWFSIVGLSNNRTILMPGLNKSSLQGDSDIMGLFADLGVKSEFKQEGLHLSPIPMKKNYFQFDFRNNPDMVQTYVPYCIGKNIPFEFSGCRSLRIKETDRISALQKELAKFNVILKSTEDGNLISWDGKSKPDWNKNVTIETYDDHRMALGMAPLCIVSKELIINNPAVVSKSYPGFWEDLEKTGISVN